MLVVLVKAVALLGLALPTWSLPSGSLEDTSPPTLWNPDGTPSGASDAEVEGQKQKKWKGPADKYFHESTFDAHYDGRFASGKQTPEERTKHLRALLRTYLATMHSLKAETWIMHGSLLGWWWNRRIMPWDNDIDVQVSASSLTFLATHYNMTVFPFTAAPWLGEIDIPSNPIPQTPTFLPPSSSSPDFESPTPEPYSYLLEINPHHTNTTTADTHNVIDARWIDMSTGLYIDITSVHIDPNDATILFCKDRHWYRAQDIYPLRTSSFEGVPARVPYRYQEVLAEEYGEESLTETVYWREGYVFDGGRQEWRKMGYEEWGARGKKKDGKVTEYNRWERGGKKSGKKGGRQKLRAGAKRGEEGDEYAVWTVLKRLVVGV